MRLLLLNDRQTSDEKYNYTSFSDGQKDYDKAATETVASKNLAFKDHLNEARKAVIGAKQTRLPDKMTMAMVLNSYPVGITQMIAHGWGLDSHGSKANVIRSIISVMYAMIPEILHTIHRIESKALYFVARHPYLPVSTVYGPLNKFLSQLKPDDRMFDAFVSKYVLIGILTVGIMRINGVDLTVLTMASDVRRMVQSYDKLIRLRAHNKGVFRDEWYLGPQTTSSLSTTTTAPTQKKNKPRRKNKVSSSVTTDVQDTIRKQKKKNNGPRLSGSGPSIDLLQVPADSSLAKLGRPTSIFKGNMITVKPGDLLDDLFEIMVVYALDKYKKEFEKVRRYCPYQVRTDDAMYEFKQQMTWFLMDRTNPATGVTIVEEFAKEKISGPNDAYQISRASELFFDTFTVVKHSGSDIVARGKKTRKTYRILSSAGTGSYPVGCVFEGRIHPYYDKYKMCGLVYQMPT